MGMRGRRLRYGLIAAAALVSFVFLNNTNLFVSRPTQKSTLLAHRGVAQRFDTAGLAADTCTAARMVPSGHRFIENTIASMRAAFDAGADIVELDVQPTTDGQFAVFHDWTLDCRTDGKGRTRDHDMASLRKLDVGHGYTADGGKTFPLRGAGAGLMPDSCNGTMVLVPINIAPWLWGWPDRLLDRFARVGTQVFVVGPFGGEGFSTGLNTPEDLIGLPQAYRGGIWTDEIDLVARTLRGRSG